MRYLYGDSTSSPLQSNFLAFLRDAVEFCVHLLQAQERIAKLHADGRALDAAAEGERSRIAGLRALAIEAAESANTDGPGSASQRAVERVKAAAEQAINTTLAEIATKLAAEHAALDAKEASERGGCLDALGVLLGGHEPHEGTWMVSAEIGATGYAGEAQAITSYGMRWTCALEFGEGHPMAGAMKVGDAMPQLELSLPEPGGFLKKGKIKPQRVDAYSVDAFSADGRAAKITLRQTPRAPVGLDISIVGDSVEISRVGPKDHGECEVTADDAQKLLALRQKLIEALTDKPGLRRRATSATIDGKAVAERQDLGEVVERVIEAAAPITNEIQAHSLSPYELVIRRLLGNDRREEVFVTTASLLDKLTPLDATQRAVFAPLGLKRVRPRTPLPEEIEDEDSAIVKTRIRPVTPVALPIYQPAPEPPEVTIVAEPAPEPQRSSSGTIPPLGEDESVLIDATSKEALASTVKRIVGSARAGRTVQAYEAYAALFEDPDFASQRPQDQRQVLKLMVLAKTPPPQSPMVVEAYRNALIRLKALSIEVGEPVDVEMIGVCETMIERPNA